jgi:hypothetical protein
MSPLAVLTRPRSESNQLQPPVDVPAIEVRDLGPLHVTWYEDGSVWARGLPPLHRAMRLDGQPGAMRLRDFAQAGARIDRCTTQGALDTVRANLADAPFAAPAADELVAAGLDRRVLARLGRDGHLLLLADGVVLLPGADTAACDVLGALPQPFTTSQARQALVTSRRVVLPLLAHLDRTGRTVRLPDDTRRVTGPPSGRWGVADGRARHTRMVTTDTPGAD